MRSRLKDLRQAFLLLLCFIFLSYLVLTPPVYELQYHATHGNNLPSTSAAKADPMNWGKENSYITTLYNENDILTDAVSTLNEIRNGVDERQLIYRGIDVIDALLVAYGVLLYYKKCFMNITVLRIPILATSKGGHAPPCTAL